MRACHTCIFWMRNEVGDASWGWCQRPEIIARPQVVSGQARKTDAGAETQFDSHCSGHKTRARNGNGDGKRGSR